MDHDDFDQEPIRGLPRMLPPGETILWQGAPDWRAMARDVLKVHWVAGYFGFLLLWSWIGGLTEAPALPAAMGAAIHLVLGAAACLLLAAIAWAQAKATVYTITDARVVMRIGAALTLTLQFPYRWIGAADLSPGSRGTGTIALRTGGETTFGYLTLWPHARPWRFGRTQPALRCVPDAARVASILARAAAEAAAMPVVTAEPAAPGRAPARRPAPSPIAAE
jgi:hypothetical protein